MKKSLYLYVSFLILGLSIFLLINSVFAWTLPTANPPQGDLPAPLDTSSIEQTKLGNLNLDNNLKVGGLLRIGLYSSHPTGTNGNLYYNTADNKFYGYQNNEWKELGGGAGFWLVNGDNIYNTNTGNVGIGTTAPGAKLEVAGQVKITGGSPGAGRVLTSDASGLATWQAPSGLPSGSIIMYSGPWNFDDTGLGINTLLGWALCNGNNGTPNLSDKFVMGTTSSSSLGGTGGTNSYSLTTAQLPSHSHSFTTNSAGSHSHSFTTNSAGSHSHSFTTNSAGSHSHSICISSAGSHTHSYYINPQQCCCGSSSSCQVKYGNTSNQTGSAGSHTHSASSGSDGSHSHSGTTGSAGDHSHSGTTNTTGSHGHSGTTASVGSGSSIDNRPSFIQLAFIMRL